MLAFFLTLSALNAYKESPDFLGWAKEHYVNASDPGWLENYKSLEITCREIEQLIGDLDTQVSYYDYSMQTELGRALRNYKN